MTPSSHTGIHPLLKRWIFAEALLFAAISLFFPAAGVAEENEGHWSLQAIARPDVPDAAQPVDYLIQKRLKASGVEQNPSADRHTLLRRVTLDLTGLPPTREEIASFIEDDSPDAWEKVVDRLLSSPHYGERWGRHWLDVARYVQGNIKVPGIEQIDLAEPYRDYVVRAFNSDKPYDRFIAEQLAGDLLGEENETDEARLDRLAAPGFLSIGPWFEECTDPNKLRLDIIDEQISTSTRAFLALDFSCARCHDHKFDPIPTKDYYALAGIFRSTEITSDFATDWKDGRPRAITHIATDKEKQAAAQYEAKKQELLVELHQLRNRLLPQARLPQAPPDTKTPQHIASFEAEDFSGHKNLRILEQKTETVIASRKKLDQWIKYRVVLPESDEYTLVARYAAKQPTPVKLEIEGEIQPAPVFYRPTFGESPEHFRRQAIPLGKQEKGSLHIRFLVDRHETFPLLDHFQIFRGSFENGSDEWMAIVENPSIVEVTEFLSDSTTNLAVKKLIQKTGEVEEKLLSHLENAPTFPPLLKIKDASEPIDLPIHIGGNVYQTEGEKVARAVPGLAEHLVKKEFKTPHDESGRRQLADWLTTPENPLTARVMVNRIWHWHFGTGLVRTPDDFGKLGAEPTHPELLDWLAADFMARDWSIKQIQRHILLSDTYQISSDINSTNLSQDADGTLLSRYPKRRLEIEAIYDSMLTAIGKVPRQVSGQALDTSNSKDRALYILTSSRSPMGLGLEIRKMFGLFGFDSSGRPMHNRDESVTASQALWWLNNPLPRYYAEKFAGRLLEDYDDVIERTTAAHEIALGRPASESGQRTFLTYIGELTDDGLSQQEAWSRACLGLFSTKSFQTLD
ncbi:DUF1549 and DUF1553 domain-containing protein [bacterium]|nr:DUF1549 and DUF1553 domain-containing protein [bacterium]